MFVTEYYAHNLITFVVLLSYLAHTTNTCAFVLVYGAHWFGISFFTSAWSMVAAYRNGVYSVRVRAIHLMETVDINNQQKE